MGRTWARGMLWTAAAIAIAAILVAGAGLPLYVFPQAEEVEPVDVVYVIGPPTDKRIADAEQLVADGVSDRILISVPREGARSADELDACGEENVECRHPEPFTTIGEAALLGDYADDHGTDSAVVLTFTPHVSRTRFIFAKCYAGDVTVVEVKERLPLDRLLYQYAYQTGAFVKAWFEPCP